MTHNTIQKSRFCYIRKLFHPKLFLLSLLAFNLPNLFADTPNILITSSVLQSSQTSPLNVFKDDLDDEFDDMEAELEASFMQLDANLEAQFNALQEAIQKAFDTQTKKIEVVWPGDVVVPNGTVWVAYSESLSERITYDFEQGYYEIEVKKDGDTVKNLIRLQEFASKLEENNASSLQEMDVFGQAIKQEVAKIEPEVASIAEQNETTRPPQAAKVRPTKQNTDNASKYADFSTFTPKANYNAMVTVAPVLVNTKVDSLIDALVEKQAAPALTTSDIIAETNTGINTVNKPIIEEANTFSEETLAQVMKLEETETSWSIKVPFVNNYQQRLIDERMPVINDMSEKYGVDVSLILAIIEAESSFNPMATSHIPAFGLMQLVPKTAGIDAYNHIYGYKKVLTPEYLYDVDNNLELGTAYIDVLQSRYLRGIDNEQNKLYSIIASYNTGVGNLANTVTGKKRIRQAIREINEYAPDDYFNYLQQNLPAVETKNYLTKVLSKREKYQHLDGT